MGLWKRLPVTSDGVSAYTAAGRSDLDGDTVYNTWGYVRPSGASAMGIDGPVRDVFGRRRREWPEGRRTL